MNELLVLNPEHATPEEITTFAIRHAARAVVIDDNGKIALLHVTKDKYFKLPGGGIEKGEDKVTALKRECVEEIGCEVDVLEEIGFITEYRKTFQLTQISYCYKAKVKGIIGSPHFEAGEIAEGFMPVWLPYAEALEALKTSSATNFEGSAYIVPRDTTFLEAIR